MLQAAKIIGTGLATTGLIGAGTGIVFEALITGLSFIYIDSYILLYIFLCIMIPVLMLYICIKSFKRDRYLYITIPLVSLYLKGPGLAILYITGKTQYSPLIVFAIIPVLVIFRKLSKNLPVEK